MPRGKGEWQRGKLGVWRALPAWFCADLRVLASQKSRDAPAAGASLGAQVGAEELSRKLGIFGFFGAGLAGWRRAGRALAAAVVSGCRFWWWILIFPCFPQFWLLPCEPEGEAAVAGVYFDCKNRDFFPAGAGCCGPKENKRNESFNIWFLCSVWC